MLLTVICKTSYQLMNITIIPLIQGKIIFFKSRIFQNQNKGIPFSVFKEVSQIKQEILTVVSILTLQFDHLHVHNGWSLTIDYKL